MALPVICRIIGIYMLGGITFLPLLLLASFYFAPVRSSALVNIHKNGDSQHNDADVSDEKLASLVGSSRDDDVAGYFTVCREYVPGGINGRPPDRVNATGATLTPQNSGSNVYQNIYRSLLYRKPPADATAGPRPARRAPNVFFVVLRLAYHPLR